MDADVSRLELTLPNAIAALLQGDRGMLLVLQAGYRTVDLDMPDVETCRNVMRQGIVAIERDRSEHAVMVPCGFALGEDNRSTLDRLNDEGPRRSMFDTLDQNVALRTQTGHLNLQETCSGVALRPEGERDALRIILDAYEIERSSRAFA
jgi:hypothetical protein